MSCCSDEEGHGHSHGGNVEPLVHSDVEVYKKISAIFYMLEGKGEGKALIIKDAGYSKTRGRVEFARGKDLLKCLQDNITEVVEMFNKIGEYNLDASNKNVITQIYQM